MKKSYYFVLSLCLFVIFLFAACRHSNNTNPQEVSNTNQISATAINSEKAYQETTYAVYENKNGRLSTDDVNAEIPVELCIDSHTAEDMVYIITQFYDDSTSPVAQTEAYWDAVKQTADAYCEYLEQESVKTTEENGQLLMQFQDDRNVIAETDTIYIEYQNLTRAQNLSDNELLSALRQDAYVDALLRYIGTDKETAFIYREYRDISDNSGTITNCQIYICPKAETPMKQIIQLNTNCISFLSSNNADKSVITGWHIPEQRIVKAEATVTYDEALTLAKQELKNETNGTEADSDMLHNSTVIYDSERIGGYAIPCYRFFFSTPGGYAKIDIPAFVENSIKN